MPIGIMLKSKIVRETLKAKGYDLDEVDSRKATVGQDLMRLLGELADDKPMVSHSENDELEVTIMKREEITHDGDSMKSRRTREQKGCPEISRKNPRKNTQASNATKEESVV